MIHCLVSSWTWYLSPTQKQIGKYFNYQLYIIPANGNTRKVWQKCPGNLVSWDCHLQNSSLLVITEVIEPSSINYLPFRFFWTHFDCLLCSHSAQSCSPRSPQSLPPPILGWGWGSIWLRSTDPLDLSERSLNTHFTMWGKKKAVFFFSTLKWIL